MHPELEAILPKVQKPARYTGGEFGEILKSRDKEQLVRYLTEDGRRPPARSTDLLTSYDRSGRIVSIDPSDRQLILKGTFGDIKL